MFIPPIKIGIFGDGGSYCCIFRTNLVPHFNFFGDFLGHESFEYLPDMFTPLIGGKAQRLQTRCTMVNLGFHRES
jgi:hypothetical protein